MPFVHASKATYLGTYARIYASSFVPCKFKTALY